MGNKAEKASEISDGDKIEWDHSMMKDLTMRRKKDEEILEAKFSINNK